MSTLYSCLWHSKPERNLGYLALRVFTGAALLTHGVPKLLDGPERWAGLGGVVTGIGFPGPAVAWGFLCAFAESFGAALLLLGLLTPAAAFLIVVTMTVAVLVAHRGDTFAGREKAMLYLFSALLFMLKGAGSYALDRCLPRNG